MNDLLVLSDDGHKLANILNSLDVENFWLQNRFIDWYSGKEINSEEKKICKNNNYNSYYTHCSSFVKSVCFRNNIEMYGPPDIETEGLANKQYDWLELHGKKYGWIKINNIKNIQYDCEIQAQKKANLGYLVLMLFKNKNDQNKGHIAVVKPENITESNVKINGCKICNVGICNLSSVNSHICFKDFMECVFWMHSV
jgi:hypothetical protein